MVAAKQILAFEKVTAFFISNFKKERITGIVVPPPPIPPILVMNTANRNINAIINKNDNYIKIILIKS